MFTAVAALTACTGDKDLFDPQAMERELKAEYAASFSHKYQDINLNQSWDYSDKSTSYSLGSASSAAARFTRAENYSMKIGEDYEVDNNTLAWMTDKLKEKRNNRALGNPFYMSVPNNSFTIVPIYQGEASLAWDLHMVVDGVDIKVWEKSQNVWVKTSATAEEWTPVADLSPAKELKRTTIGSSAVKATSYVFENLPVGADMHFYLKIVGDDGGHANLMGAEQSSLDGMMLTLQDCPTPSNLPEGNEVMIIGCEDLNIQSDWDMNDVVFMVYGKPSVPQPKKIEQGEPITQKKTVRYMIEDLGATDDFDFNDIVLDVSEIRTVTPIYTNGVLSDWEETGYRQEAIIRHLGGELPFILKIGDTQLEERQGKIGANPNEVIDITGWDINTHNVSIQVRHRDNAQVYNNVVFPKAGEAPMIIAVNPTTEWMNERVSVPETWFYVPEQTGEGE